MSFRNKLKLLDHCFDSKYVLCILYIGFKLEISNVIIFGVRKLCTDIDRIYKVTLKTFSQENEIEIRSIMCPVATKGLLVVNR